MREKKVIDYRIARVPEVLDCLSEGCELYGIPFVYELEIRQAMVKYEETNK